MNRNGTSSCEEASTMVFLLYGAWVIVFFKVTLKLFHKDVNLIWWNGVVFDQY